MIKFSWKKKAALAEQLKFFGAKKQGFISVYAKKPRILVKAKCDGVNIDLDKWRRESLEYTAHMQTQARDDLYNQGQCALYQQQMMLGVQNSQFAFAQRSQLQAQGLNGLLGLQAAGQAQAKGVFSNE